MIFEGRFDWLLDLVKLGYENGCCEVIGRGVLGESRRYESIGLWVLSKLYKDLILNLV